MIWHLGLISTICAFRLGFSLGNALEFHRGGLTLTRPWYRNYRWKAQTQIWSVLNGNGAQTKISLLRSNTNRQSSFPKSVVGIQEEEGVGV